MATLIKIDRNGSKYYEGYVTCDRCGGQGGAEQWKFTGFTCYKCNGTGKVWSKWIERTPEYEAKLAERRAKRQAEREAAQAEEKAQRELAEKLEAERKAREEALENARKAISQYVGEEGEKVTVKATYEKSAWFEAPSFGGWGTERRYVHTFKDVNGNVFVWKTGRGINEAHRGEPLELKGIVKGHSEYDGEKQTILKNCKLNWLA